MGCIGPLGFLFCLIFSFFLFFPLFLGFFYKLILWSQGRVGKVLDLTPHLPKFTTVQKKKKEAIGLVSGLFTENSWPSPKGPVSSPTKRRRSLTATPLAVYQHLMKVRGKQQWTLTPPSPLLYSIEFPYSKHIHFFFKQLSDSKVPHPHKEK